MDEIGRDESVVEALDVLNDEIVNCEPRYKNVGGENSSCSQKLNN